MMASGGGGGYEYRFCPQCGTLMDLPSAGRTLHCPLCRAERVLDPAACSVRTVSGPEDLLRRYGIEPLVPLRLDVRHGAEGGMKEGRRERAKVNETCPKCGNKEMEYYTMQLRSADEGQTVFYECVKCKHKYSLNT